MTTPTTARRSFVPPQESLQPNHRRAVNSFPVVIDCNSTHGARAGEWPARDNFAASLTTGHGSARLTGACQLRVSDILRGACSTCAATAFKGCLACVAAFLNPAQIDAGVEGRALGSVERGHTSGSANRGVICFHTAVRAIRKDALPCPVPQAPPSPFSRVDYLLSVRAIGRRLSLYPELREAAAV